ncbi:TPA: hypothetical protein U8167_003003 [Pseudomonas aeruginosa]|nr:hypothetical protein [Pseudomonas aeruginosa]HEN8756579.1 hypothetical protein [Pseudomonas aeruginosa]HEN8804974.1 hypothetical protein [Pseudomonas aeruginosa]
MKLIGLAALMEFGAQRPNALPALTSLAALIEADEVRDLATLLARLPAIIAERTDHTVTLHIAEADCYVVLKTNDKLEIAQVIAAGVREQSGPLE